jgi:RNA polymerase sigma factor (sigma-70 family)
LIDACAAGDPAAADTVCDLLRPMLLRVTAWFFPQERATCEDIVQDTLMAMLGYLQRRGGFTGVLRFFASAMARNRCRDVLNQRRRNPHMPLLPFEEWIADPSQSPLDELLAIERLELLQEVIASLSPECQELLEAFYIKGLSMEQIRQEIGLVTVQGVYHRRSVCLKKALRLFNQHLTRRS